MKQITLKISDEQAKKIEEGKLNVVLFANEQLDAEGGAVIGPRMIATSEQKLANPQAGLAFIIGQTQKSEAVQPIGGASMNPAAVTAEIDTQAGAAAATYTSTQEGDQVQMAGLTASIYIDFTQTAVPREVAAGVALIPILATENEPIGD